MFINLKPTYIFHFHSKSDYSTYLSSILSSIFTMTLLPKFSMHLSQNPLDGFCSKLVPNVIWLIIVKVKIYSS